MGQFENTTTNVILSEVEGLCARNASTEFILREAEGLGMTLEIKAQTDTLLKIK
jgi:hypothetical protein